MTYCFWSSSAAATTSAGREGLISTFGETAQIAKFMGPTWSTPGSCRPHVGRILAPWTLLSGPSGCPLQYCMIDMCVDKFSGRRVGDLRSRSWCHRSGCWANFVTSNVHLIHDLGFWMPSFKLDASKKWKYRSVWNDSQDSKCLFNKIHKRIQRRYHHI